MKKTGFNSVWGIAAAAVAMLLIVPALIRLGRKLYKKTLKKRNKDLDLSAGPEIVENP